MKSLGYKQSESDHTLFIKYSPNGKLTLLVTYVNDMIITGDDEVEKRILKEKLLTHFEMKELGKLKYFHGIEVAYSRKGIFIFQRKYLKETRKHGCKTIGVPIEQNHKIEGESIPGKLIYLSHTRPDIAYAVSVVGQFMHDPRESDLQTIERILQYLKASYLKKEGPLSMEIYTDADYARFVTYRRSTFGYCMFLGGNLVTWRCKK
uniref:Reverse transcriptase Ty1/copia-type domain-containing protein n=1 Tax=Cajanus cajan TaxID=3821 RepID=A0A151S3E9_CAJCA|nr:hypothetical protein KK1_028957 [Cajanus cajan]